MKKAIELADTTFRAYKKKNGATVLHLKTYLVVYADADFRAQINKAMPSLRWGEGPEKPIGLGAFMKESPHCYLQLAGNKQSECDVSYSAFPVARSVKRPAGSHWVEEGRWVTLERQDIADEECTLFYFWAETVVGDENIFGEGHANVGIAKMKLLFHTNFPGRPTNEKIVIRRKVAIVRRGRGW